MVKEMASLNTMSTYLRAGYWQDRGTVGNHFNLSYSGSDGVIKYSVTANRFDSDGISDVRARMVSDVLTYLGNVTGIKFEPLKPGEVPGPDSNTLYFSDINSKQPGGGIIGSNFVQINIPIDWNGGNNINDQDRIFKLSKDILHETLHGMGLGHTGPYNESGNFKESAIYENDTWQNSTMSYFKQTAPGATTNPNDSSYAIPLTMMSVDALTIDALYGLQEGTDGKKFGTTMAYLGDTTYGFNTNVTDPILSQIAGNGDKTAFTIIDGGGVDTIDASGWSANQRIDLTPSNPDLPSPTTSDIGGLEGNLTLAVGTVVENAVGGSGNDLITGNEASNALFGNAGNDTLNGEDSDDSLFAGVGDDVLNGGNGNDDLFGDAGNDRLNGDAGDDRLYDLTRTADYHNASESGTDVFVGGEGNDMVSYQYRKLSGIYVNLTDNVGPEGDTYVSIENVVGTDKEDVLVGDGGNNQLWTMWGDDTIDGRGGDDYIAAGGGDDVIMGEEGNDALHAHAGDDTLKGGNGNDTLFGYEGNDKLYGEAGDDWLEDRGGSYETPTNELYGGDGNDHLVGLYATNYLLDGGNGEDTASYDGVRMKVEANLSSGNNNQGSTYVSIENLEGSYLGDALTGNGEANKLWGHSGNDILHGHAGDDVLHGGSGDDIIWGDEGTDVLFGNSGADEFHFNANSGADFIRDFEVGVDKVVLSGVGQDQLVLGQHEGHAMATWANGSSGVLFSNLEDITTDSFEFV